MIFIGNRLTKQKHVSLVTILLRNAWSWVLIVDWNYRGSSFNADFWASRKIDIALEEKLLKIASLEDFLVLFSIKRASQIAESTGNLHWKKLCYMGIPLHRLLYQKYWIEYKFQLPTLIGSNIQSSLPRSRRLCTLLSPLKNIRTLTAWNITSF